MLKKNRGHAEVVLGGGNGHAAETGARGVLETHAQVGVQWHACDTKKTGNMSKCEKEERFEDEDETLLRPSREVPAAADPRVFGDHIRTNPRRSSLDMNVVTIRRYLRMNVQKDPDLPPTSQRMAPTMSLHC